MFRCAAAAGVTGHPGRVWVVAASGCCGVAGCSQRQVPALCMRPRAGFGARLAPSAELCIMGTAAAGHVERAGRWACAWNALEATVLRRFQLLAGLPGVGTAAAGYAGGVGAGRARGIRSRARILRRLDYSQDFLKWVLQPLGTGTRWMLGMRLACAHEPAWRAGSTTRRTS